MKPVLWIVITILLGSALVLFLHLGTTGEEFSRYNVGWTGTSQFFAMPDRYTTKDITRLQELAGLTNTTLLIIAPDHSFTAEEGAIYRDFVSRGNTILLADDFGTGPAFLAAIGSGITLRQNNLSSLDRAYDDPSMVVASSTRETRFLPAGRALLLDQAATLTGGETLVSTTIFSWEDTVPDRILGANESLGRYPVMAQETIGDGTLIVLSDPSVFINGMEDPGYANRLFLMNLAQSGPIAIDGYSSRVVREDVTGEIIHAARSNTAYTFAAAALLAAAILVAWHRRIL